MRACLLIIFISTINAKGQPPLRFSHLTGENGLSQSNPNCIFQDSKGFLWVGTQDGLNRFDGYNFKVFKNDPFDSTTLTHNWIWTIAEDHHGDLWIGTFQGLCKYVRNEDRFIQYFHDPKDSTSISGNRPNFILTDKKGRIWISSWGAGLNYYDEKTKAFRRFYSLPDVSSSLSNNGIRTMLSDNRGNLWIGTWSGGLNRMVEDGDKIKFKRYSSTPETGIGDLNQITSIAEDQENNLWITSYEEGLVKFDKSTEQFERIENFSSNDLNKVLVDSKNNVWVGSNNGLYFQKNTESRFHHLKVNENPTSISSNLIYEIFEDRQGMVWVSGKGLCIYDPKKNVFQSFRSKQDRPSEEIIWSFCEDDEGKIWIGAASGPVQVFDPVTKKIDNITIADDLGNIAQDVQRIVFHDNIFWLATRSLGLVRFEKQTSNVKFFLGSSTPILREVAMLNEVFRDREGMLWIGSTQDGLIKFNPISNSTESFSYDADNPESIGSNYINSISEDDSGNLWIGHWGDGISVLNKETNTFRHYNYDPRNVNGLSDQIVSNITQENDSIFWVCTHTGFNKLNINTGVFTHYLEKDGLGNNVTYELLKDPNGNLWISTNAGLSRFDPSKETFTNYSQLDGLPGNEFNANAILKSSAGEFYFGGIDGFTVFKPADMQEQKFDAPLVLTSFSLFNNERSIPQQQLELKHYENFLTFQFAALDLSSPHKIQYAVKLEGLREDWENIGNYRVANYTNLDPGQYTFRVRAANANGIWGENEISIPFTIHAPFWQTNWFLALCFIGVIGLIYFFHRLKLQQSLKVERLRNKIARDLHDEVGSSLTRISIYSDLLQSEAEQSTSKNHLLGIRNLSREIVDTMSDIVWSIDNNNDSCAALIIRIKDFASEILYPKNIQQSFEIVGINETKKIDPAIKQNIYLICKEALNNIVKHAHASEVQISIINQDNTFMMRIRDNGRGYDVDKIKKGNGIRSMHRRAADIQAKLTIDSTNGTTLSLYRKAL